MYCSQPFLPCRGGPKFTSWPNLLPHLYSSISREAMPHIHDPRGPHQSPKITKNTPAKNAFPLAPFLVVQIMLLPFPHQKWRFKWSHPQSGRLHHTSMTPIKAPKWATRLIAISRLLQANSNRPNNKPTNQPTDKVAYRVVCTQLKMFKSGHIIACNF